MIKLAVSIAVSNSLMSVRPPVHLSVCLIVFKSAWSVVPNIRTENLKHVETRFVGNQMRFKRLEQP